MTTQKVNANLIPSAADQGSVPFVNYQRMLMKPGERQTPQWLKEEGLCFVGCWETLPWRRYSGIATTWAEQDYAFEHSQAFIDDIRKLGCNAVVVPYDCGHGEAFIESDVQMTKAFIQLAHENGLKVGTYFRADIVWVETLSDQELKEIEGGFQISHQGQYVIPFGTAAWNICHHHPGVMARFKRHVERVIVDLKTDMLHLDGMIVGDMEGSRPCRCPNCVKDFRQFLVERYGHDWELATKRFSHPFLEKANPPAEHPIDRAPFDSGPVSPHWCEWTAFRCQSTSRVLAEVASWAKELNPEVAIEINNALPAVRENAALGWGTDVIGVGHYTDASWSEDGYGPRFHENGLITHRVRQFKFCRAVGTFGLTYMHEQNERELRQNLAHTAAFNLGNIGCIGFPPHMNFSNRYSVHFETKCEFMRWMNQHRDYFRDARSTAQIAIWRPREGMALSGKMAYAAAMRMEQLLIETCQGFDIVFEESMSALSAYDLIILPNVECMSLSQIEDLTEYVAKGGSLLVGQDSALFDLWHRRRIENPWGKLFGKASAKNVVADAVASGVAGVFVEAGSQSQSDEITCVDYGKGRAAFVPQVVDPATQPSMITIHGQINCDLDYSNWVVPERKEEIEETIHWLMNARNPYQVHAERGMLAEFLSQEEPKRNLLHLVNLCAAPQKNCKVTVTPGIEIQQIEVLFPPTDTPPQWCVRQDTEKSEIIFDVLDTYVIVVIP